MLGSTTPADRDHVARLIRANWPLFARHGGPAPELGWTTHTMRSQEGTPR